LFCGLGGWSDGFASEGFEVLGVEIEPKIAKLYKHPVIVADVRTLNGEMFKGFDVIVGSPPCRNFSSVTSFSHRWKKPVDINDGLTNINAFLGFVEKAQPIYWLMENVRGLKKYIDTKPTCQVRLSKGMYRCFWGRFPGFLVPMDLSKKIWKYNGSIKLRKWERARIPFPIATALARAIKQQLLSKKMKCLT